MRKVTFLFICIIFSLLFSLVLAQDFLMDIKIEKQTYSVGENLSYSVLLMEGGVSIHDKINVTISDANERKSFNFIVDSNDNNLFFLQENFPGGYWKIEAFYKGRSISRFFTISEKEDALFEIRDDKLIIKNIGNVPYTKTIRILIGEKEITQKQYIDIGAIKEIKLVAPKGNYDVQVFDGSALKISKKNIYLSGTGAVIGAIDEQLLENKPLLGGVRDKNFGDLLSSKNFSFVLTFVLMVFALFILILIERRARR